MAIFWGFQKRTAKILNKNSMGTSLMVQWLRFHAPNAEGLGSIPNQETKIFHVLPMQGAWVKSLVREPDPACHSEDPAQSNKYINSF